ncbi:unnamed protein product, partial [Rotaria magnacalcarata]
FGPTTLANLLHKVFLLGLPFGVCGSNCAPFSAAIYSLSLCLVPHAVIPPPTT